MSLTKRQEEVLMFICQQIEDEQRPPTRQEITDHFGWASPNAAEDHLKALQRKGVIENTGKSRGIRVLPEEYLA